MSVKKILIDCAVLDSSVSGVVELPYSAANALRLERTSSMLSSASGSKLLKLSVNPEASGENPVAVIELSDLYLVTSTCSRLEDEGVEVSASLSTWNELSGSENSEARVTFAPASVNSVSDSGAISSVGVYDISFPVDPVVSVRVRAEDLKSSVSTIRSSI